MLQGRPRAFVRTGLGEGKKIEEVLLDAEYYSHEVMEYLDEEKVRWAIVVDQDEAVKRLIRWIPEEGWQPYQSEDEITTDRDKLRRRFMR